MPSTAVRLLLPAAVVTTLAGTAGARPNHMEGRWRTSGGVGVRFGSLLVNNLDVGIVKQGHLDGGMRNGRLWVYGEYDLNSLTLPQEDLAARGVYILGNGRGLMHRLGGNVRYSFGHIGERDGGSDIFIEGGLGLQHYRWDAGGAWTRPDLALGIGISVWGASRRQHGGFALGLRVHLAGRNDVANARAACGGPCDYATTPTGLDRSFLFDMTILFGK